MKCNICGRNIQPGQVFCACGTQVASISGGAGELDLNINKRKSSPVKLFIILAIVAALFIGLFSAGMYALFFKDQHNLTHKEKWERINRSDYSITLPAGMKEADLIKFDTAFQCLDCFRSSEAAVAVGVMRYNPKDLGSINRKKLQEMLKKSMPAADADGTPIELKEYGNMFYYEVTEDVPGAFLSDSTVHGIIGCFVGNSGIYVVEAVCPEKKYNDYEEYIFAWYDSFKIN